MANRKNVLSARQLGRFLGQKPAIVRDMDMGVVACQNLQAMRFPGLWVSGPVQGVSNSKAIWTGCAVSLRVDPPVGGFPAGDVITGSQMPVGFTDAPFTPLISSGLPSGANPSVGFAPGIFEIWIDYQGSSVFGFSQAVSWRFFASAGETASGDINQPLGAGIPSFGIQLPGSGSTASRQLPAFRLVAEKRWSAILFCDTALTDAQTFSTFLSVRPLALFDDIGNVF